MLEAGNVVDGVTVDKVVLNRVTETMPFVADIVVTEEFRVVVVVVGTAADVVVETTVAGAGVDALVDVTLGALAVVGVAVVKRVEVTGGGVVGLFLGSSESTTPTGPFRSISVSGQVISSA